MYIISATSVLYSSPLYMICMSLGNKDYFIVIVIVILYVIIFNYPIWFPKMSDIMCLTLVQLKTPRNPWKCNHVQVSTATADACA